ncbi:MAG: replication protein DnaC [Thermoleophilaceae bacterium]|nr:replication protein DnaC [Thermoleophilaceae bacterium]
MAQADPGEGFCPENTCDGTGWILGDDDVARPCACRKGRISRARTRNMGTGVPRRFLKEAAFDRNPIRDMDPAVVRDIREFCRKIEANLDAGRGKWFHGDVGTGKTLLAMTISKAALDAGKSVAIYSVPRLLSEIKETYEADSKSSYMELFERLREVDLLHLDDLGAEKQTEWVLEQLYSVVNERWQDERSIILTTNLTSAELKVQVGERTVSRLVEICGDEIPIMGRDLRTQAPGLRGLEDEAV